jgi:SAM-dependent methyltransferase
LVADDKRGPGFHAVDDHPEVTMLLTAMDETARWEATQQLRAWERERLSLRPGRRLLDVGCGLGAAALALSLDLGEHGEVVGVDGSEVMLTEARVRAARATCRTRFVLGDAGALSEPDDSFDAVRSERMLQWVPDPGRAVAEMARVVRPGGLVCLTDTDWSTFDLDVGDPDISRRVRDTYRVDRRRPTTVGGRLAGLAEAVGLRPLAESKAAQVWSSWDSDASARPDGWAPMSLHADDLIDAGNLAADEREWFIDIIIDAARRGRFAMRLTMHALVAAAPAPGDGASVRHPWS